jgi:hypothetical protein
MTHELEVGIRGSDTGDFTVHLRYRGAVEDQPPCQGRALIDFGALDASLLDPSGYGRELTRQVFADPSLVGYFRQTVDRAGGVPLRVRLFVDTTASRLYGLRWELLVLPWDDPRAAGEFRPLSVRNDIYFSRFLSSFDWRGVQLRPKDQLRALVAVADPEDLANYSMAPIDARTELDLAGQYLAAFFPLEVRGPATLNQIVTRLLDDEYDILYLICHGAIVQQEPRLYLSGADGLVEATPGGQVVARLAELTNRPRLVVLASCQSAGAADRLMSGEEGSLIAIAPKLVQAGIPAVLAMQADISMETLYNKPSPHTQEPSSGFLPTFFAELARHGQVDRAAAAARGVVAHRHDFWVPVVLLRTISGLIWYEPGFVGGGTPAAAIGWDALVKEIKDGTCTPILGSGLLEGLVGSSREVARHWAEDAHFAMSPHDREDLPQVAQFLSVMQSRRFPAQTFPVRLREELKRRCGDLSRETASDDIDALLAAARVRRRRRHPAEPHEVLARLPFPIYITTNTDDQLNRTLIEAGKDPQVELCRWHARDVFEWPRSHFEDPSVFGSEPFRSRYKPSPEQPLVYHLYGQLRLPPSVVLTEDEYFDYLIGATANKGLTPTPVREALGFSSLLFLGFRLEEWDFRVLFRSILAQGGKHRLSDEFPHVAVQLDPEEGRHIDTGKALKYLEKYFARESISIYRGSVDDFVRELAKRCQLNLPPPPPEAGR